MDSIFINLTWMKGTLYILSTAVTKVSMPGEMVMLSFQKFRTCLFSQIIFFNMEISLTVDIEVDIDIDLCTSNVDMPFLTYVEREQCHRILIYSLFCVTSFAILSKNKTIPLHVDVISTLFRFSMCALSSNSDICV